MLSAVKIVDKAAAESALKEEERARKKENKQLKKVRHRAVAELPVTARFSRQQCASNRVVPDAASSIILPGEEGCTEAEAAARCASGNAFVQPR